MKNFARIAVLLSIASLFGCHNSSSTVTTQQHIYNVKQQCPTLMQMKVGEVLVVSAAENPSTGYQWQLVHPLKYFKTEETFLQQQLESPAVGVGGEKTFQFTAQQPGQDLIELVHVRPWEASQPPEQQWRCRIRIS